MRMKRVLAEETAAISKAAEFHPFPTADISRCSTWIQRPINLALVATASYFNDTSCTQKNVSWGKSNRFETLRDYGANEANRKITFYCSPSDFRGGNGLWRESRYLCLQTNIMKTIRDIEKCLGQKFHRFDRIEISEIVYFSQTSPSHGISTKKYKIIRLHQNPRNFCPEHFLVSPIVYDKICL